MALLLRSSCPPICSAVPAVLFNRRRLAYAAPQSSLSAGDMARSSGAEFFQDDTRPIMLFDGVCNLCNGGVRFVRENDRNRRIRFQPLQSEGGRRLLQRSGRSPDDISSVVLVEQYRSSTHLIGSTPVKPATLVPKYLDTPSLSQQSPAAGFEPQTKGHLHCGKRMFYQLIWEHDAILLAYSFVSYILLADHTSSLKQ
ncbi:uncharacterized protein LOC110019206 isoform X1 [Phalaenopsis equestris]|uniref:uncharacterized protein LOC110019206 isoform X1 n=1 Tax=Phalaenopsis equestris TaxID=78828 RepID=UPI0009E39E3D|nr:uncharacterized protein LOC110019206 isoform X1 [Phalaenopsis equestris]